MTILQTAMFVSGEGKAVIYLADTIEHEGKLWIVPTWLESPALPYKMPERIICLDNLPHQKGPPHDFVLNYPIPKDVLYGQVPTKLKDKYIVIMRPDIKVPIPTIH